MPVTGGRGPVDPPQTPMKMLKSLLLSPPTRYLLRGRRLFFVCGMSRSGNHAFVNWLANALEGRETDYRKVEGNTFLYDFGSERTLFLNNVRIRSTRHYMKTLWNCRDRIRVSRALILSAENVFPDYRDWRVPPPSEKIFIRRSVLNLVASRLKGLKKRAADGVGDGQLTIDGALFRTLSRWEEADGFLTWSYDCWQESSTYRKEFLGKLGLEEDIMPRMGSVGSSSFEEEGTPGADRALKRYEQVTFPPRVVELISRYEHLLSPGEKEFMSWEYPDFREADS